MHAASYQKVEGMQRYPQALPLPLLEREVMRSKNIIYLLKFHTPTHHDCLDQAIVGGGGGGTCTPTSSLPTV
jgi:hypothetical protein